MGTWKKCNMLLYSYMVSLVGLYGEYDKLSDNWMQKNWTIICKLTYNQASYYK